jgi:aspartate beta-hydroxylase
MTTVYNAFVDTPPLLDSDIYFPQADEFAGCWQSIRDEALRTAGGLNTIPQFHDLMPEQYKLSGFGEREWRILVLRAYGLDIKENMNRCPTLTGLVKKYPHIKSASLSFLAPGKVIPTHRGPFRGITRYYLGIDVPTAEAGAPGVTLTIDGTDHRLGNGEWLLWDDTYPHSVTNHTDKWRIALLLDIYRERMTRPLRWFTNSVIYLARRSIKSRKIFPKEFV